MRALRRASITVLALAALATLGSAPSAYGGTDRGSTEVTIARAFESALERDRTRIAAASGALVDGRRASFPATGGDVGTVANISHAGALVLTRREGGRTRSIRIAKPQLVLSSDRDFLTAKVGGRSMTLARLADTGEQSYDPTSGEVAFDAAATRLTGDARSAIRARLKGKLPPRELGASSSETRGDPVEQGNAEAPELVRPSGAIDVESAALTWRLRESFVNYVSSAEGGGTSAIAPATPGPLETAGGSPTPRVYEYGFGQASGWASPQTDPESGGGISFDGGVNFRKPDFGIDLDATSPELHLDGEEAMLVALLNGREGNADQQNRRAVAVDLGLGAVDPTVSPGVGQTTYEWEDVPATVPDGNDAWPLAGYYFPGDPWGEVSFSYTVEDGP